MLHTFYHFYLSIIENEKTLPKYNAKTIQEKLPMFIEEAVLAKKVTKMIITRDKRYKFDIFLTC